MCDHRRNYAVALTLVIIVCLTRAKTEISLGCDRKCGGYTIQYPFGFSGDCEILLNCTNSHHMELGGFQVQKVSSSSIFINVPAKCNRTLQSIQPLFGQNFAPTRNNSLLLQTCSSAVGGCVIPTTSLMGNQLELAECDERSDDINCFTESQARNDSDILTYDDVSRTQCKFLFSAIANAKGNDVQAVSLQFQVLELGWWLESPCSCSKNANCSEVHLKEGKLGFRCQCPENYIGDGYDYSTGCQRSCAVRHCHGARYISKVGGGLYAIASILLVASLGYNMNLKHSRRKERERVERLLREAAGSSNLVVYSYVEIEEATNFFSEQRQLGSGAFGTVYLGKLHNEWVAVKKIKHKDNNNAVQVINEIKLLSSVSHPNLVRILGCWIGESEQILVLEFVPNGTLSQHLQTQRGAVLPWITRLTIATETANAIAYLHAVDPPIYHRDIKSSNILLDHNFNSKVADFGLSRLGITDITHISTGPQGTPGYVDPSYEHNFHLSNKSDVYSFGVVLVEIITALKAVDLSRPPNEVNLAALAVDRIGRGCVDKIMDPFLLPHADAWTNYSVEKVAELAFRCLDSRRDIRPAMMEVAEELEYIKSSGSKNMEETMCTASAGESHIHEIGNEYSE